MMTRTLRTLALAAIVVLGLAARARAVEVESDIEYARPGGVSLKLDAYLPAGEGPFPGVLVVHGGGWRSGSKRQLAVQAWAMARAGLACFAIDYRLAPEHKWPAQIEDVRAALAWLKAHAAERHVDPAALGAYGYSAGGHLVALLATDVGAVQAVVAGGAPCDFSDFPGLGGLPYLFGGSREDLPDVYRDASPALHVTGKEPPILFFHGGADLLVPNEQPRRMIEALRKAGRDAELYEISWAGHLAAAAHPGALQRATAFFLEHLVPGKRPATETGGAQLY
jgi:acetyl esterase/lipase